MIELVTYGIVIFGGGFLGLTTWIVMNKARLMHQHGRLERVVDALPAHESTGQVAQSFVHVCHALLWCHGSTSFGYGVAGGVAARKARISVRAR